MPTHCITADWITSTLRNVLGVRPGLFIDVAIDRGEVWIVLWFGTRTADAIIPVQTIARWKNPLKLMRMVAERLAERAPEEVDIHNWN